MAGRTPEQKKLSERKDAAYRFCKELAELAGYEGTAAGFDELLRMIDAGEGYFEFVFTYTEEEIQEAIVLREASESPEVE